MFSKELRYLLLIIIIFIAACIETDIYLPTFIDMMAYFSVSEDQIQSLLTWNFFGICISGPIYGPLSDAIGRKKPLLIALGLFLFGSIITCFAHSFNLMLFGRVLQGLGSGGCFTLGTAIIFDAFKQEKAIQAVNKLNTIVPFIMAGAPMAGGYLNQAFGFRANFLAIAICVLASLLICFFFLKETLSKEKRVPLQMDKILKDFAKVFSSVPFWQTTLVVSLIFSGYLAFLSTISVLFVLEMDVDKHELPYHQAALLVAWLCASLAYKRAIAGFGNQKIKAIGTALFVIGGIGFVLSAWLSPHNPYFFTFFMMFYAFGANWVQGLYFPEGMELFPEIKGITASLLNSARLLIAAGVVGIASTLYDATIYPIVVVNSAIVVVTFFTILSYERQKKNFVNTTKSISSI